MLDAGCIGHAAFGRLTAAQSATPRVAMLRAAFTSACSVKPHDVHRKAGREDEFHEWYDEDHLPAVLELEGFVTARRFVGAPNSHGDLPPRRFLALYEIETDDLSGALAALSAAPRSMRFSDAFDHVTM